MALPLRLSLSPCPLSAARNTLPPSPSLVLRLSSPSLLDAVLTVDGAPHYAVETRNSITHISRCTPAGLLPVAQVNWPLFPTKSTATAWVQLGGAHVPEEQYLRRTKFSSARKFRVPGMPHALKWRQRGAFFDCVPSHESAPIAVFEPAVYTSCARLKLYGAARLPNVLIDHIVVTALLMTAHADSTSTTPAASPVTPSPAYSLLDSELDLLAPMASKELPTLRRARSFAPTSSGSSSWSSPPASPALPRRHLPTLTLDISASACDLTASLDAPASPSYFTASLDVPASSCYLTASPTSTSPSSDSPWEAAWKDDDLIDNEEPPPPYEQIGFTVRVPRRAVHSKHTTELFSSTLGLY